MLDFSIIIIIIITSVVIIIIINVVFIIISIIDHLLQWDAGKNDKSSPLALRRCDLAHVLQFIVHNSSSMQRIALEAEATNPQGL